ncbi:MAG: hypothetical protein RLY83_393 [Actinomycetota bacterium]|jgi:hypothetical protein
MIKAMTAVALSLAIFFQMGARAEPVQAATCSIAGGQSGRLKYSGQLSTVSATVCGNQIWKIIGKPTRPVRPVKPGKPRKYANNFTVIPDKPKVAGAQTVAVGEVVNLSAITKRHIRNRMLFWYPSQVRFTPKTFAWNFGDGSVGAGIEPAHAWKSKGTYNVKLVVGFAVKYRIIGRSGWIALNGLVFASSAPFVLNVGEMSRPVGGNVVLVHWSCDQKPFALGC